MKEVFKNVAGYEGVYLISSLGRVISKNYKGTKKAKLLKRILRPDGYYTVKFKDGLKYVHLLVWDNFGDKPRNGRKLQVDHIDNNKWNCAINNLQLLSQRENISKGFQDRGKQLPTGVSVCKQTGKFRVNKKINGRTMNLGRYFKIEDAQAVYNNTRG